MARLLVVGAGRTGSAGAEAALGDGVVDAIAAVVDPDPAAGEPLAARFGAAAHRHTLEVPPAVEGDRALVAVSPSAAETAPDVLRLLARGYHVVTTCEELAWPPRHTWNALHTAARTHRRAIVMTGVDPGFIMDRLPLLASAASRKVESVAVTRRIDSADQGEGFLPRTGHGLAPAAFAAAVEAGTVGHRGLWHSAKLLAHTLGWPNRDLKESIEPIVEDGVVTGFRQHVTLRAEDRRLELAIVAAWRLGDPGDTIVVEGEPPLRLEIVGGYHGRRGAAAQIVTALARCTELEPSFYRPSDLPLRFG